MQTVLSALLNYMETSVAVSISCIHERYKACCFGSAGEDSRAEIPGYACQESRSEFSSSSLICSQGIVRRHVTTYSDFFFLLVFPSFFLFLSSLPFCPPLPKCWDSKLGLPCTTLLSLSFIFLRKKLFYVLSIF